MVDWVDQAILFTAIGDPRRRSGGDEKHGKTGGEDSTAFREVLCHYGVRTATSMDVAVENGLQEAMVEKEYAARIPFVQRTMTTTQNLRLIENWQQIKARKPGAGSK